MMNAHEYKEAMNRLKVNPADWTSLAEHEAGQCKIAPTGEIRCLYCHGFGRFRVEYCAHNIALIVRCSHCEKEFTAAKDKQR